MAFKESLSLLLLLCTFTQTNPGSMEFQEVTLPLKQFRFYYRGKLVPDHEPINLANVTEIGLQTFGGVYSEFKQSGASTLEIEWIKAI